MLRNRLYYILKPYLPWALRARVRGVIQRRLRRRVEAVWPVLESAAVKPEGWAGWPHGKQFAVVLTHDVERSDGLAKCRRLAELELREGFRSSFNFIPEGEYRVSDELRSWLAVNGFEVGVHDLHHDGKLFTSYDSFRKSAERINGYLRDWNASGFRAGFMLRNLDWYHHLDISYDASTFDTDPFEPMPDGAGTLFPFWVPAPPPGVLDPAAKAGQGYVELPYTLPQDSTMFLVFREQTPGLWLRKLDWIAEHGGMVLLNTHPDYMRFDDGENPRRTFPSENYRLLLEHLRTKHAGRYWQASPRDVAEHVKQMNPRPLHRTTRRVCMVTHSHYVTDVRVIRYAEALTRRGDHVDVISLRASSADPVHEVVNGVHVHRIHDRFSKNEVGAKGFIRPLLGFFLKTSLWITRHHARQPYDLLHIHNIPDFLVFTAWYPKLRGVPVLLDVHDVVPEFFQNKFGVKPDSLQVRLLRFMERVSASFANHVIIANHLWLEMYSTRTGKTGQCTPFINYVDLKLFSPSPERIPSSRPVIIFPGGLQWHQGLDIAIRAFAQVLGQEPEAEFHIYGDGSARESLIELTETLGLRGKVLFFAPRPVREIVRIMETATIGVVPKRADSFGNEAYSTKIMEFMALGVPVIVSSTKIDRFYFNDSVVRFFESGNVDALACEMVSLLRDPEARRQLSERGRHFASDNSWDQYQFKYLKLVDELCR